MYGRKRQEKGSRRSGCLWLLDMGVIGDVVFAIAVVAIAPGAVAELQIRMGDICGTADSASVGVGRLGRGGGCLVGTGIKGDGLVLGVGGGILCTLSCPSCIDPPGDRKYIGHIGAEEQKIVGQGDQAEEIIGEGSGEEINSHHHQVDQSENPGFHGDDEEEQEVGIGIHGGVAQEHAQIQIGHIGLAAENQTVNIHQHHAGEVEEVEFESTPAVLHGPSQRPVAEEGNGDQQDTVVSGAVNQGIGEKTPDLALQDGFPVEAEQGIEHIVSGHLTDEVDHGGTRCNIEHQVGNAAVAVFETEPFKAASKVFQGKFTPKMGFVYFNRKAAKSLYRICKRLDLKNLKKVLTFCGIIVKYTGIAYSLIKSGGGNGPMKPGNLV